MKVFLILNIWSISLASIAAKNVQCCSPGYLIRLNSADNKTFLCNDPVNNKTEQFGLKCGDKLVTLNPVKRLNLTVNEEGKLVVEGGTASHDKYCFGNRSVIENKTLKVVGICIDKVPDRPLTPLAESICIIISVIFLTITATVYAAMPELRDLQGVSVICLCGSLAISFAILAGKHLPYSDLDLCAARAFFTYLFAMAAFFWMTAIAIQVLLSVRRPVIHHFHRKEFMYYALPAFGIPVIMTIIMAIVNFAEGDHMKPGIGRITGRCWFSDKVQQWIYMYGIMSLLIIVNIVIFVRVSIILWPTSFSSNNIKAMKYKFIMMVRLFVLMGLPWAMEIISSMIDTDNAKWFWTITEIINCLFGPIIFAILVIFRRRAIKALHKHGWLCCCSGLVERYLTKAEDLEEDLVHHTEVLSMENETNRVNEAHP